MIHILNAKVRLLFELIRRNYYFFLGFMLFSCDVVFSQTRLLPFCHKHLKNTLHTYISFITYLLLGIYMMYRAS